MSCSLLLGKLCRLGCYRLSFGLLAHTNQLRFTRLLRFQLALLNIAQLIMATILLLTSEMVTNSVQHARTERVRVSLERVGPTLRVAVADDDPQPPILQDRDDSRIGGLGIQMVERMSSAWGVEDHGSAGKQVWFEVEAT